MRFLKYQSFYLLIYLFFKILFTSYRVKYKQWSVSENVGLIIKLSTFDDECTPFVAEKHKRYNFCFIYSGGKLQGTVKKVKSQ